MFRAVVILAVLLFGIGRVDAAPVNDMFADRVPISNFAIIESGGSEIVHGTVEEATIELDEPEFSSESPGQNSVWYTYKARKSGIYLFTLVGPDYFHSGDFLLELYTGNRINKLNRIGKAGGTRAKLRFIAAKLSPGKTYVLRVSTANLRASYMLASTYTGPKGGLVLLNDNSIERTIVFPMTEGLIGYFENEYILVNSSSSYVNYSVTNGRVSQLDEKGVVGSRDTGVLAPANPGPGWVVVTTNRGGTTGSVGTKQVNLIIKYGKKRISTPYFVLYRPTNPTTTLEVSYPGLSSPINVKYGSAKTIGVEVKNTGFRDAIGCRISDLSGQYTLPPDFGNVSVNVRWKKGGATSKNFVVPAQKSIKLDVSLRPLWPGILYSPTKVYINCANTSFVGGNYPTSVDYFQIDSR